VCKIANFLKVKPHQNAFGALLIEAYGQTEETGAVTFTWPYDASTV